MMEAPAPPGAPAAAAERTPALKRDFTLRSAFSLAFAYMSPIRPVRLSGWAVNLSGVSVSESRKWRRVCFLTKCS